MCRFVFDQFGYEYVSTLGTKVTKKSMTIDLPDGQKANMLMTVWDIMGERGLIGVVKESYFNGASGIMAVSDLTRDETLPGLHYWLQAAAKVVEAVPTMLVANKVDLIPATKLVQLSKRFEEFARANGEGMVFTSAKTGENVELAFRDLGARVLQGTLRRSSKEEIVSAG